MEAPDKIYTDNRGVYSELPIFSQADANVEYIRKDAIIEWLESRINSSDGGFVDGLLHLAYKDVIEHLNEM